MSWHAALAYALTGQRWPGLAEPDQPDLPLLVSELSGLAGGREALDRLIADARRDSPWPRPVPAELREDLGAAQLAAALAELRRTLGLDPVTVLGWTPKPPTTRSDRRLIDEVPPHHGC